MASSPDSAAASPPVDSGDETSLAGRAKSMLQLAPELARAAMHGVASIAGRSEGPRYRAFISYNHRDARVARWLHRAIETYRIPKELVGTSTEQGVVPRRLAPVFRDEDELAGAAELGPVLETALKESAALIVVCSPSSARSQWVDREVRFFRRHCPGRPVLALIAAGVPGSEEDCFPSGLRCAVDATGRLVDDPSVEPLAPDLQKQDRQVVRMKLVAALLGVRYNDLYRRDRRRARRWAAGLGTLGLVIIAALTGLSIAAVSYARVAVHEKKAADRQRLIAEQQRDLAEKRAWLAQQSAQAIRAAVVNVDGAACPKR